MKSSAYGAAMNAGLHAIGKATCLDSNKPVLLTERNERRLIKREQRKLRAKGKRHG